MEHRRLDRNREGNRQKPSLCGCRASRYIFFQGEQPGDRIEPYSFQLLGILLQVEFRDPEADRKGKYCPGGLLGRDLDRDHPFLLHPGNMASDERDVSVKHGGVDLLQFGVLRDSRDHLDKDIGIPLQVSVHQIRDPGEGLGPVTRFAKRLLELRPDPREDLKRHLPEQDLSALKICVQRPFGDAHLLRDILERYRRHPFFGGHLNRGVDDLPLCISAVFRIYSRHTNG